MVYQTSATRAKHATNSSRAESKHQHSIMIKDRSTYFDEVKLWVVTNWAWLQLEVNV